MSARHVLAAAVLAAAPLIAAAGSALADDDPVAACVALCQDMKPRMGESDWKNGPCLSDRGSWSIRGWVCDVAHSPRKSVDDYRENQCRAWGRTANHFVEVNESCSYIRKR